MKLKQLSKLVGCLAFSTIMVIGSSDALEIENATLTNQSYPVNITDTTWEVPIRDFYYTCRAAGNFEGVGYHKSAAWVYNKEALYVSRNIYNYTGNNNISYANVSSITANGTNYKIYNGSLVNTTAYNTTYKQYPIGNIDIENIWYSDKLHDQFQTEIRRYYYDADDIHSADYTISLEPNDRGNSISYPLYYKDAVKPFRIENYIFGIDWITPSTCPFCGQTFSSTGSVRDHERLISVNEQLITEDLYDYTGNPIEDLKNTLVYYLANTYAEAYKDIKNFTLYTLPQSSNENITFKNIKSNGIASLGTNCTIESGTFSGSPAITGNPTIKKGTVTDTGGTASTFTVDYDSEIKSKTTDANGSTTYTINLSNPPIIIDWDDFPGIELPEMDFAAPVITVTREPSSTLEATKQVTLTIKAKDPNGHDHETPISINGGDYMASPATYTVTENQSVSVVAQDTFGNVREMVVNVTNIDSEAPVITNIEQNSDKWTKDSVKLTITATDDVNLHKTSAYRYQFTPNDKTKQSTDSGWVASRFFTVTEAGKVIVTVRDSLGNESKPEVYNVVNIDKIAPTATATISPADTKVSKTDGVLVSLKLIDTADSITGESSGMATLAVKWDENSAWEEATEKKFYENGVYNIRVRDAVGNISEPIQVTISNISTDKPVITSFTRDKTDNGYVTSPVTLTVQATANGGLHNRPYSWDGGQTWTSVNSLKVYENKEYGVMVRDTAGNTTEAYIQVLNIDSVKPTGSLYMVKGAPEADPSAAPEDWVWKLRVEADDIGSGVSAIDTLWDGQSYSSSPVVIEIAEAGIYGVTITDKAGNQTYVEKVITEEAIGGAGGSGNGEYVDIKVPESGSAGEYFNAAVGDLVYGKTGAYNKVTKEFKSYQSGEKGITVDVVVGSKSGRYVTGTVNFNNVDYKLLFNGNEEVARGKSSIPASVFISIDSLTTDINNGRIRITIKEYTDSACEDHVRDGVAQLYTNVQITDPTLMYTYDSIADKLTLSAVSTVAGIKGVAYDIGSDSQTYTEPVSIGGASSVTMVAEDNVGGRVTITKTAEELELNGGGGGSLPTEANDGSVNALYQSSSSFESYIIGGSKNNTNNLPDASVYEALLGN